MFYINVLKWKSEKPFLTATEDVMIERLENELPTYEVTGDDKNICRMYFDIDYDIEGDDKYSEEVDTIIKDTGKKYIGECVKQILNITPVIAVATASYVKKYSWRYFVPNIKMKKNEMCSFIMDMNKCIKANSDIYDYIENKGKGLFDTKIYDNNRKMRCINTSKPDENRPLKLVEGTIGNTLITGFLDNATLCSYGAVKEKKEKSLKIKSPTSIADTSVLSEGEEEQEQEESKNLLEKCETIKQYVNAILEEDNTYFDEYNKWCQLGFICSNETDAEDEGLECFIELSKLFHTDSGKKHVEKSVKKQYYSAQKERAKKNKLFIGSLHLWLEELNPEHELLHKKKSQRAETGDLTADEIRETEKYINYRNEFEKDYFKLMTPMKFIRVIEEEKGKIIHFYSQKDFLDLTRDEEGMPTFFVKSSLGSIPKKFNELWLDDEKKTKYSRLKFDPLDTPYGDDVKKKNKDYNCFSGFINKDNNTPIMSNEEFEKTAFGKLFDWLFTEELVKEYIKSWFSHILQKPNIKTKVAVILYSKTHGVGKNTIVDYFISILGNLLCGVVECIDDITKNFNNHLCNKLFIYGDEINANAKKVADRLKAVITRPKQNLEKKGVDAVEVDDYTNWFFTTNNENCFKIEEGDRRLLMVRCREERQKEISIACYEEMKDKNMLKKMFAYFYNYKQSEESIKKFGEFHIGSDKVIDTQYKMDLLYENKPAYIQMFFKEPELVADKKLKATELYELTQQYAKRHYLSCNYTSTEFGLSVSKFFNEENRIKGRGNSSIFYKFPCRTEILKLLFQADERYYRYVYQLPVDFTPKFEKPKEITKTDWKGDEYIALEENDD